MTDRAKGTEGKTALAQCNPDRGMTPGKTSQDARLPQGPSPVTDFPVLEMGARVS